MPLQETSAVSSRPARIASPPPRKSAAEHDCAEANSSSKMPEKNSTTKLEHNTPETKQTARRKFSMPVQGRLVAAFVVTVISLWLAAAWQLMSMSSSIHLDHARDVVESFQRRTLANSFEIVGCIAAVISMLALWRAGPRSRLVLSITVVSISLTAAWQFSPERSRAYLGHAFDGVDALHRWSQSYPRKILGGIGVRSILFYGQVLEVMYMIPSWMQSSAREIICSSVVLVLVLAVRQLGRRGLCSCVLIKRSN